MSRRRWWLIGGAAVVIVLIVAGLWIWVSTSRTPTPEEAADSYLQALESGDADAVKSTGIEVSPVALEAFTAATEHIEDAEIVSVGSRDGGGDAGKDTSTIEVSFRLDGADHTATLSLERTAGRWTVDASGLGTMTATTTIGSAVSIGEAILPVGEPTLLLPAAYPVTAAPVALLGGEGSLTVLPGEDSPLAVETTIRPEATAAAQEQLDEHLETCTEPGTALPTGCGIRIPWGTEFREVSDIRYRIEQLPTIALSGAGFRADGGVLVATVTGTGQDDAARTTSYRTESWSVRGDVSFTEDGVALTVW